MLVLRYAENGVDKTHSLKSGLTLVGRLPSCDLVLADPSVSRHHASFRLEDGGRCFLQDAGSRYGTLRNGQPIIDEAELSAGDVLKIGENTLTLEQHVPEQELLSEDHQVSEGPGTILRPIETEARPTGAGDGQLIRLLAEVGRTLVSSQALPEILNRVVDVAFSAVPAERAFLMLRDSADEALAARVLRNRDGTAPANPSLSRSVVRRVMRERVAILASDATADPGLAATDSIVRLNIRSFMCAPLWNKDDVIGVMYVDSPRSARFAAADLDAFTALANAAAVAIEQARLSNQLLEETRRRERLQRYHSPAVVSRILHGGAADGDLRAQEREVTVMFCDIVGFTSLCEPLQPAEAAAILNAFLTRMTDVVSGRCAARRLRCALRRAAARAQGGASRARHARGAGQPERQARGAGVADAHRHQFGRRAHRRHWLTSAPRVHGPRRRGQHGVADRGRDRGTRPNRHFRADLRAHQGPGESEAVGITDAPRAHDALGLLCR
jgi:adenylate cyclase